MSNINIEDIMDEIRTEIKNKGYKEEDLTFEKIRMSNKSDISYEDSVQLAENTYDIQYYRPFNQNGVKARITTFIKKIMRKLIRNTVEPITMQQNQFNYATLNAIKALEDRVKDLEEEVSLLRKK